VDFEADIWNVAKIQVPHGTATHRSDRSLRQNLTAIKPTTAIISEARRQQIQVPGRQIMNQSTSPPAPSAALPPTDLAASLPHLGLNYAVINTTITKGGDWVAIVGVSQRYRVVACSAEYWQLNFLPAGGPKTILLDAHQFYRARIGGKQFGLYIDAGGNINYLQEEAFVRELDRRFRDCVREVDLSCDGDWTADPFSRSIPAAHIGENQRWLTAS
jgi:hypothetical protein